MRASKRKRNEADHFDSEHPNHFPADAATDSDVAAENLKDFIGFCLEDLGISGVRAKAR